MSHSTAPGPKPWIDVRAVEEIDGLIIATHLSTMELAVHTHADEMSIARGQLEGIFVPANDPLSGELRRALNIGFMYGSLIAINSQSLFGNGNRDELPAPASGTVDKPLPESLFKSLEAATNGLDPGNENDNSLLFTRLSAIEIEQTQSSILASSVAVIQEHMAQEFNDNHRSAKSLDMLEMRRLQSVFYAGILVGALLIHEDYNFGLRLQ